MTVPRRNWGDHVIAGRRLHEPRSLDELATVVVGSTHLRVVGTGHTFNDLPDSRGDLVSLHALPRRLDVAPDGRVTLDGATRYVDLCGPLDQQGRALEAMASLPHISVAGACATGTHGSGDRVGSLASAVSAMEVMTAGGEIVRVERATAPDELDAMAVSLGAMGVVTALTLDTVPSYPMRQDIYEDVALGTVVERLDDITALGHSVSLFTTWQGRRFHQVWCKQRMAEERDPSAIADILGARPALEPRHPVPGHDAAACTSQLGLPGPWHERLPHFRGDHVPSSGHELQSEYLIDRQDATTALVALFEASPGFAAVCQVSEVRTIAADDAWLSPAHGRPSVAIHFTWQPDRAAVLEALQVVERTIAPFDPRPHWGKLWTMPVERVRASYPRVEAVAAVRDRWDPGRVFSNRAVEALLGH